MRNRMPRWSEAHLATLLCQRQVVPVLLRLGPKHLSFLLHTQPQAWGSFREVVCVDRPQGEMPVDAHVCIRKSQAGPVSRFVSLASTGMSTTLL